MSPDPRLVRILVGCYPARWRRTYGDEYGQLLCDLRVQRHPRLVLDSLRGAARARLLPGGLVMSTRSPMTVAVWAAGLFTVAGLGFQKLSEDLTVASGVWTLLVVAAAVALLALVVAAVPTAVALVRGRDHRAWWYVAVPFVACAAWLVLVRVALAVADDHGPHATQTRLAAAAVGLGGVGVVAATAWATSTVLRRVPAEQPRGLRRAALTVVAVGMGVATALAVLWGLAVHAHDPGAFSGDQGLVATPFVPSWLGTVVLMAGAAALAGVASRRQAAAER
jgi:hypothetical protein